MVQLWEINKRALATQEVGNVGLQIQYIIKKLFYVLSFVFYFILLITVIIYVICKGCVRQHGACVYENVVCYVQT
jgi:hypothetical protein